MHTESEVYELEAALSSKDATLSAVARHRLDRARFDLFVDLGWFPTNRSAVADVRREYSTRLQVLKADQKVDRELARWLKPEVRQASTIQRGAQWLVDYLDGTHNRTDDLSAIAIYGVRCAMRLSLEGASR